METDLLGSLGGNPGEILAAVDESAEFLRGVVVAQPHDLVHR
jgi:hypothetical protein